MSDDLDRDLSDDLDRDLPASQKVNTARLAGVLRIYRFARGLRAHVGCS